jgi:group I intron endonuclease
MPHQSTTPSLGEAIDEVAGLKSGIYQIRCQTNGKVYVGSAVNIARRWRAHICDLTKNRHHSSYLQRAWNKYGPKAFAFDVVELVEIDRLIEREQFHIDATGAAIRAHGFNMSPTAGSCIGVVHSEETRRRLSERARSRPPVGDETRRRLSEACRGKPKSEDHVRKVADSNRGRKLSEEHRQKIREAWIVRRCRPVSDETRQKLSDACRGKPKSDEWRRKASEIRRNRAPISEETRQKMREGQRRRWARTRESSAA